jgi:hypothetical protein
VSDMNKINLVETQQFEVWFLPKNRAYEPGVMQTCDLLDEAQAYREKIAPLMFGAMEIVRVRMVRQLMARAPT